MRTLPPLRGIIPPLLTPLTASGGLDRAALRRLAARLLAGGVDAVFVGGTAGLGPLLTERLYAELMEESLAAFAGRLPLLAGVIETSTPRALERIRLLESLGVEHFVLTSTYYLAPRDQEQILTHFGRCAEATTMAMTAYDIPACVGVSITPETIAEMARRGWLAAVKDSSGDAAHFARLCALGRETGLPVFQGLRPVMLELQRLGAAGCVPVPGNVCPALFAQAWRAAQAGDVATAARLQERIDRLWSALVAPGDFLSGSLYALAQEGLLAELLPEPLSLAAPARRTAIDQALREAAG